MAEAHSNHDLNAKMLNVGPGTPQNKNTKVEWVVRVMSALQLVLVVALIYTLTTDGECEEPIRLWIKVLLISFIVTISLVAVGCAITLPAIVSCCKVLFDLFIFIWYIIGTVWFFQDDTCEVSWYTGYVMAYVLVVFFFVSLVPYLLCCFVVCGAVVAAKKRS
jgi:hypothetical protein